MGTGRDKFLQLHSGFLVRRRSKKAQLAVSLSGLYLLGNRCGRGQPIHPKIFSKADRFDVKPERDGVVEWKFRLQFLL